MRIWYQAIYCLFWVAYLSKGLSGIFSGGVARCQAIKTSVRGFLRRALTWVRKVQSGTTVAVPRTTFVFNSWVFWRKNDLAMDRISLCFSVIYADFEALSFHFFPRSKLLLQCYFYDRLHNWLTVKIRPEIRQRRSFRASPADWTGPVGLTFCLINPRSTDR